LFASAITTVWQRTDEGIQPDRSAVAGKSRYTGRVLKRDEPERLEPAVKAFRASPKRVFVNDQTPYSGLFNKQTVKVWVVDLDDRCTFPATVDALLSPDEQARAARFVFEPDAWRFKLCRATLRVGLALHLGKPAKDIQLRTSEKGKPYLCDSELYFNVSHCGGTGLLAFTLCGEIGVDVEAVRLDVEGLEIAAQNFHSREIEFIKSAEGAMEQARRFTRVWTRKEAVLKATGTGITDGLNSFDVSEGSKAVFRSENSVDEGKETILTLQDVAISENFLGAIAGPNGAWTILQSSVNPGMLIEKVL
jgi:4'-phosphopantetheinyl transferase